MEELILMRRADLENLIEASVNKAFKNQKHNQSSNVETYFTIDQAADFLNLAKQTLYGFTSQRQIPFIKRAKRLLFKKSDLELWLMEGKTKSISEIENNLKGGGNGY
jgi:excisionase family DNA binding protein